MYVGSVDIIVMIVRWMAKTNPCMLKGPDVTIPGADVKDGKRG